MEQIKYRTMISTKEAINVAVQAYYINQEQYLKYDISGTLEDGTFGIQKYANKNLIKQMIVDADTVKTDPKYDQVVQDIMDHQKSLLLSVMSGTANNFEENVFKLVGGDEIATTNLGYIAPLPKLYFAKLKAEQFGKTISESKEVGSPGDVITGQAYLHEARFIESRGFHVYTFAMDGNLLTSFSGKSLEDFKVEVGKTYKIKAKVKRSSLNKFYGNVTDTVINYLKIIG
tara:strand:+ start:692 stop:1381 length:690 start_codon:yes stop_codon:yes gene_type:complete